MAKLRLNLAFARALVADPGFRATALASDQPMKRRAAREAKLYPHQSARQAEKYSRRLTKKELDDELSGE